MVKIERLSWEEYFIEIVKLVAKRSSCLSRQVGSLIVNENRILATGYNGAVSGIESCVERGCCLRASSKSGENLNLCMACHSEQNAILQCAKMGISCEGATIYVTTKPCSECMKSIIQCGIKKVVYIDDYNSPLTDKLISESNIEVVKYKQD